MKHISIAAILAIMAAPAFSQSPISIQTTPGTTDQAIVVTQTGPSSATTGPLLYNSFSISNPSSVTTPALGSNCSSGCTNGMANAEARAFHIEMNDSSASTIASAISAHMVINSGTPAGDKIAVLGNAYTNKVLNAFILGGDFVSAVDTGGSAVALVAAQFETAFYGTGSATNRIGVEITNDTSTQASSFDAALAIDSTGGAGGAFQKGISFGSPAAPNQPLSTTADAIYVQQPMTIANFCNCGNFTFTGAAPLSLGTNYIVTNLNNQNGTTGLVVINSNPGNATSIQNQYSNGTNGVTIGIGGTGLTGVYQGHGFITANAGAPLIVGTSGAQVLKIFTNNAEVARFQTSGGLSIGTTSDPSVGMIYTNSATFMIRTKTSYNNGAAAGSGTLTNAPASTNPTKWIPIDDNGTTRYVPAW